MPSFAYAGTVPRAYPESRDAEGVIVGSVEPGDVRAFEKDPPDEQWIPAARDAGKPPAAAKKAAATTPPSGTQEG